jgi:hypothetical protein
MIMCTIISCALSLKHNIETSATFRLSVCTMCILACSNNIETPSDVVESAIATLPSPETSPPTRNRPAGVPPLFLPLWASSWAEPSTGQRPS